MWIDLTKSATFKHDCSGALVQLQPIKNRALARFFIVEYGSSSRQSFLDRGLGVRQRFRQVVRQLLEQLGVQ